MILLDTHALIWWIDGGGRLSDRAVTAIERYAPALVSPISFWELAVLVERGRVSVDRDLARWCRDLLASGTAHVAPLTPSAAITAARLPGFHGDPADRFIYATARELGVPLVSKDARMGEYARQRGDIEVIW
ncbi:MAG: type II toxin-antitoxin system VapC family toxin [Chloroflexi bacterium]|nr:type II toxin-antitoxin system VapC family toxin [Chloroflexota bacterium]